MHEIIGHPLARLLAPDQVTAAHRRLRRILAGAPPEHLETTHIRRDGTLVDVSATVSVVLAEDGEAVGASAIVRDISDRRQDERRIAAQLAQIQDYALVLEYQKNALEEANARLAEMNVRLEALATTDGLMGLLNQRVFSERLTEEFRRARRYAEPLSLVLLDVDRFKAYNDSFGHLAGNVVLREMAGLLRGQARETDLVARFGGDEFALILSHTDADEAGALSERLREAVEQGPWGTDRAVTASFGVCALTPVLTDVDALIVCADAALYRAKTDVRNRVEIALPAHNDAGS